MEKMEGIVMKNIKERAKEYSLRDFDGYYTGREKAMEEGYITGATEQQAIDIEKAKTAFGKACGWLSTYPWYNAVLEEFIKNMEE